MTKTDETKNNGESPKRLDFMGKTELDEKRRTNQNTNPHDEEPRRF